MNVSFLLFFFPAAVVAFSAKFNGGAGVGRLVVDRSNPTDVTCHNDIVLAERLPQYTRNDVTTGSSSGLLYVPPKDLPKLHLARILSVGPGKLEDNGSITPCEGVKVGDIVICKNPWGIGPKDEETTDGKKLSYMRFEDIAAVVKGKVYEEETVQA